jgi:hypothetical protein
MNMIGEINLIIFLKFNYIKSRYEHLANSICPEIFGL